MKAIIAGSRNFGNYELGKRWLDFYFCNKMPTEIVSGGCSDKKGVLTYTREDRTEVYGADGIGERWAAENAIPVKIFMADWIKFGNAAGPIRNTDMALYLEPEKDGAVVFWNGHSRGSGDIVKKANDRKLILRQVMVVVK